MKSIEEMVESLLIDFRQVTDESYLANKREYLKKKINGMRATLIREEHNSPRKLIDKQFYSTVDGIDIECQHKTVTINGITFTSKHDLFIAEIPRLVPGVGLKNILYVGDENLNTQGFIPKSLSGLQNNDGNLYTGNLPMFTFFDNYLLMKNIEEAMNVLTLIALVFDPTSLSTYTEGDAYPVPSEYKIELLVKKDLLASWGMILDTKKSEADESIPTTELGQQQKQTK